MSETVGTPGDIADTPGDLRYGVAPVIDSFEDFVPAPGRSVVYQVDKGQWRPAQITAVFGDRCNLVVFLDGDNDKWIGDGELVVWKTSRTCGTEIDQWLPRVPVDLDS